MGASLAYLSVRIYVVQMPTASDEYIGVTEAARRLGRSRRQVLHMIAGDQLHPVAKLDGRTGAYLIPATEVDQLRTETAPS